MSKFIASIGIDDRAVVRVDASSAGVELAIKSDDVLVACDRALSVTDARNLASFLRTAADESERMRGARRTTPIRYANECGNCGLPIVAAPIVCTCEPAPSCRDCGSALRNHGKASPEAPWECPGP